MAKMTPGSGDSMPLSGIAPAPNLDQVRREELRNWKYDSRIVDALLGNRREVTTRGR